MVCSASADVDRTATSRDKMETDDTCLISGDPAMGHSAHNPQLDKSDQEQQRFWDSMCHESSPFTVCRNYVKGRYLVATRDIQPGEIIFEECPLVWGPHQWTMPICLGCYRKVDGSYCCSKCNWPMCGPECEAAEDHVGECAVFSDNKVPVNVATFDQPDPRYECLTPLRCLLLRRHSPHKWNLFMSYMSHNASRRKQDLWRVNQINTVDYLRKVCRLTEFDDETIHTVMGILYCNAHDICGKDFLIKGFFAKSSLICHDCMPNSHYVCHNDFKMVVRAGVVIRKGDEINTCYTPVIQTTQVRRKTLKEGWYFDCLCARCVDPTEAGTYMSALKCSSCQSGNVVSTNPVEETADWKCDNCESSRTWESVKNITDNIRREIDNLQTLDVDGCEEIIRRYKDVLHPHHVLIVGVKRKLIYIYGRKQGYLLSQIPRPVLERKGSLCKDLLSLLSKMEFGIAKGRVTHPVDLAKAGSKSMQFPLVGQTLYELHGPLLLLANMDFEQGKISSKEFSSRLKEVKSYLEDAARILGYERKESAERAMADEACSALRDLEEWIMFIDCECNM